MPVYEYFCETNGRTVEVSHDAGVQLRNWGEVCYVLQQPPGETDPAAPVRRVIRTAPAAVVEVFDSELRNAGFTKLVKRDDGVYENVTASGDEARYMKRGRKETMPHLHKKIRD
jgi:hypothetical protein